MENNTEKEITDDDVIALAVCIYESQGYPKNSYEMLDSQLLRRFISQAEHLIKAGYRKQSSQESQNLVKLNRDKLFQIVLSQTSLPSFSGSIEALESNRILRANVTVDLIMEKFGVPESKLAPINEQEIYDYWFQYNKEMPPMVANLIKYIFQTYRTNASPAIAKEHEPYCPGVFNKNTECCICTKPINPPPKPVNDGSREELIKELMSHPIYLVKDRAEEVADFILQRQAKIVEPLVKLGENHLLYCYEKDTLIDAIYETLKLSGLEKGKE